MKKERLTIEDRILIEELLRQNYKIKNIARTIDICSSTISRKMINMKYVIKQINSLLFR